MSLIRQAEGLGKFFLQQDITFSNDTGVVSVFTVTGDVKLAVVPIITTTTVPDTSANIRLGVVGFTDALIVDSDADNLVARGIWVDQTPTYKIEPTDRFREQLVTDGTDVILTLSDQVNSGAIRFYCFWTNLSSDGKVVNA